MAVAMENLGMIPIQIQMKVTADLASSKNRSPQVITNPDLRTQMTLERKGSAKHIANNQNSQQQETVVLHKCDIAGQVQRNLKIGSELRNAKRLMPLYKEMINKVAQQETNTHHARKNHSQLRNGRQARRKSANRQAAAAMKGMNEAIGIKKLDTIAELRQRRQQTVENEMNSGIIIQKEPANPTTNIEISQPSPKVEVQRPASVEKRPVSQVTVSRNGTPLQDVGQSKPSVKGPVQSTVLLGNPDTTNEVVQSFILNDEKIIEKQTKKP